MILSALGNPSPARTSDTSIGLDPALEQALATCLKARVDAEQREHFEEARQFLRSGLEETLETEIDELGHKWAIRSPDTLRVYVADCKRFKTFCDGLKMPALPACPEMVSLFLMSAFQEDESSLASIRRMNAAIAWMHRTKELPDPTADILVRAAVRWIGKQASADPSADVPHQAANGHLNGGNAQLEGASVADDETPHEEH